MKAVVDSITKRPRFCVWELTLRCNMRCLHCGSIAGGRRGHELETDEALRLCDQLGELGCERVTLLGGEPFVREDWEQIARRLRQVGVRVNVITNGWLLTDVELVRRIKDAGLSNVALSIDGMDQDHDMLRNRQGSYARVMQAFAVLQGEGLPTAAVSVITKLALQRIDELYAALVEAGALLWQIQIGVPNGRLDEHRDWCIEPTQIADVMAFARKVREEKKLRLDISDNVGYYGPDELQVRAPMPGQFPYWTGCYAGCQAIGIDANGDVKGCLALQSVPRFIEGNVRERSLREIWERPGAFAWIRDFNPEDLGGFCAQCEYAEICRGGCSASRYGFTGDLKENPWCLHRALSERGEGQSYGYTADEIRADLKRRGYGD